MSIIIPSKNIYDIKNPVVRDNIISQVKIDTTKVLPDIYEYEKPVYREFQNITEGEEIPPSPSKESSFDYATVTEQVSIGLGTFYNRYIVAACSLYKHTKSNKINITIPKHQGLSYLKKIYYEEENNNSEIKYSLYGDVYEGDVRGTVRITGDFYNITNMGALPNSFVYSDAEKIESDTLLRVPTNISITEDYTTLGTGVSGSEQTISATSNTNIYYSNSVFRTEFDDSPNGEDSFSLSFEILQETKLLNLSGTDIFSDSVNIDEYRDFYITGKYQSYKATRAEITIYGDTIGISLEDGTITYGTGNKPYTLNGSELTQNNPKQLAESVLSQYENGKETATILCDINDFRDDSGFLAISPNPLEDVALKFIASLEDENDVRYINHTFEVVRGKIRQNDNLRYSQIIQYTALNTATQGNQITLREMISPDTYYFESGKIYNFSFDESVFPMTFEIGDLVIPMVKNPNSPTEDMPMSKKSDGTAKQFRVVGIDFDYDGAVWQKLSLQEV